MDARVLLAFVAGVAAVLVWQRYRSGGFNFGGGSKK